MRVPPFGCRLVALMFSATMVGCTAAPIQKPVTLGKVDTGPGTITEARTYLQGHWSLVSMDLYPPNEPPILAAAQGTLVYDDFANLDVSMQLTPAATTLAARLGIPVSETGTVTTTGRAIIDVSSHAISYVLEGQAALRPATHPLDLNRPRYWEVNGNTLTLRTKDAQGNVLSVSVWKKD